MPTAQRSQCRYFAYQLWRERETDRQIDRQRPRETETEFGRERERGDRRFRFTEEQQRGVLAERNTPAFSVFPLTL